MDADGEDTGCDRLEPIHDRKPGSGFRKQPGHTIGRGPPVHRNHDVDISLGPSHNGLGNRFGIAGNGIEAPRFISVVAGPGRSRRGEDGGQRSRIDVEGQIQGRMGSGSGGAAAPGVDQGRRQIGFFLDEVDAAGTGSFRIEQHDGCLGHVEQALGRRRHGSHDSIP